MFDWLDDLWDRVKQWKNGSASKGCMIEFLQVAILTVIVILFSFGCGIALIVGGMWLCGGS